MVVIIPNAYSQDETRVIPNGVVLSASATLQAAQGELVLYVGDRAELAPNLFRPVVNGGVEFRAEFGGHRYLFHAAEEIIETTSQTVRMGVIYATATAKSGAESDAVVWCAWRHRPVKTSAHRLLLSPEASLGETIETALPWRDDWTWYVDDGAYHRQDAVVYFVNSETWSRSNWVRPPQRAYAPLAPDSLTGFMRFSRKLLPNQSASLKIFVPFAPVQPETWALLNP